MNEFETKAHALRLQYKAQRIQIQKDCDLAVGHINTDLGRVKTIEAREALWAEKQRIYETTRQSMKYNRLCYRQQLDLLQEESRAHFAANPSRAMVRQAVAMIARHAKNTGQSTLTVQFGKNSHSVLSFA